MIEEMKINWDIIFPYDESQNSTIEELRKLRGKIFYEDGLKPHFKVADNKYYDDDKFDFSCYHILARSSDFKIVGAIRVLPMAKQIGCVTSELIGIENFNRVIMENFSCCNDLAEISRWIVAPDYKNSRVSTLLVSGALALVDCLGCIGFGNAERIEELSSLFGAVLFEKDKIYFSQKFNANIQVFYADLNRRSHFALRQISRMNDILRLSIVIKDKIYKGV
ncbi:MAG: GNAT family N-acetyltransferase [Proteobacteria bacterium]|nr:GNAT family N-acetyltransferase [Pseudomonadota bacterium]